MNYQSRSQKNYSGTGMLLDDQSSLKKYNQHIVSKFSGFVTKYKSIEAEQAVDFGAGLGTLAQLWFERNRQKPICVELDPNQRKVLSSLGFHTESDIDSLTISVPVIYTSNVLEHIEDDVDALIHIRKKLTENGLLLIYVPAFQFLFSELDTAVGHFRRYNKKSLTHVLRRAGFTILHSEYADSLGVLATLLIKVLGFRKGHNLGNQESIAIYDKFIFPLSRFLDSIIFKNFLGKNLFMVATNKVLSQAENT